MSTNRLLTQTLKNPKRKPQLPPAPNVSSNANSTKKPTEEKPLPPAKKFLSFSNSDSRALEAAYQELLEKSEERFRNRPRSGTHGSLDDDYSYSAIQDVESDVKVPVNEDYLFDVDIAKRELGPVYWQGPIYEVRRGTWFTQEGSKLVPCEENLAAQLEEGYLKVKPWLYTPPLSKSEKGTATATKGQTPKSSAENLKPPSTEQTLVAIASPTTGAAKSAEAPSTPQSHRLFGTYMNSVATYQDDTTAWLSSDGMFSWVTSAVYGTFAGAGHLSGIKLIRGYQEPGKGKDKDKDKEKDKDIEGCRTPVTPITPGPQATATDKASKRRSVAILGQTTKDPEITTSQDEELRKRQESEIRNDYNDEHDSQGREIEHLVLVTHGIGQMLSLRMESINFIHDVNLLRKTINREHLSLDFDVSDLYCLGSPIGLFQMLKGRTIAARQNATPPGPVVIDLEDPDFEERRISSITGLPHSMSSPKVEQLFNIIHPSDPIAYRMEPLISPAMKTLKPQNLPYTKKGIFGSVAPQGLSSIGMKVGQSVSGLWSSFSSGITTSLINRSLGLTNDEVARFNAGSVANSNDDEASEVGKAVNAANKLGELTNARKRQLADPTNNTQGRPSMSGNEPTLIDDDLETLYSKFQKTRKDRTDKDKDTVSKLGSNGSDKGNSSPSSTASLSAMAEGWDDVERRSNKIRREEQKVRALNRNSRVDFTIQEGVLDYNPINAIASHMGYWADEDVSHFFLSQLLSNRTGRINTANKRRR
ncbi:putative phospholipase C20G8.02 mitochondrial [Ceratocystis platani]|uniref:Putative phospholipase C20G8.02 mitochondrial n=1 Tax=Ceratocystis fimbriata f. sp. platani TaxID=88771 RepID=A0A0F8CZC9_CERFI|nr:putative phospholipase C20G8.02 mitochondrial [Ceratocystis platani]